jgi:cell division protein FtsB
MTQYGVYEFDNRDTAQMYEYMEARIEALKRRIEQLETEIEVLRSGNFRGARYPIYV